MSRRSVLRRVGRFAADGLILLAVLLALFFMAHAVSAEESVRFEAANDGGGKIVLLTTPCPYRTLAGKTTKGLRHAYAYGGDPSGWAYVGGCWALVGGEHVGIVWEDNGVAQLYDASRFYPARDVGYGL